jgi:alanine dehydrogenase
MLKTTGTISLDRKAVETLLSIRECIPAVEQAFKLYAEGSAPAPGVLGIHAAHGGLHIKAGTLPLRANYFVAKLNANFPGNPQRNGLPAIQGIIAVFNADNGNLLALMDSIHITILRTGAATAVAANYLAKSNSHTLTICGAGNQGKISVQAIQQVRSIQKVFVFDIDDSKAHRLAGEIRLEFKIAAEVANDLPAAIQQSDICVTCTPSTRPFVFKEYLRPGTFLAAVGADSEHKQELDASLLASTKIVTDLTTQCATIGELHHAIEAALITTNDVHAELGEIIVGKKQGRMSDDEIILFDSTGTALQDIAAATIVYEKAQQVDMGMKLDFANLADPVIDKILMS